MANNRSVIAFALLRQSSEALQTDLLGGVSILIRPLISDLVGTLYNSEYLAQLLAEAYGISVPSTALEDFAPRLVSAGILKHETTESGAIRAVYREQDEVIDHTINNATEDFDEIINDFLAFSKPLLNGAQIAIDDDSLINSFLNHLSTLDFSAIKARPIVEEVNSERPIILGAEAKERKALSEDLKIDAAVDTLVASYVLHLKATNIDRLGLLARVADGALGLQLVLDLQAPVSVARLTSTTVIVDTPILLSYLDLASKAEREAAEQLLKQISQAGAKIAAFQHSIDEAEGILTAIQQKRIMGNAYGATAARMNNTNYRAYFESMRNRIAHTWVEIKGYELIQETSAHFLKNFSQDHEQELIQRIQFSALDRILTRERDAKSVAEVIRRLGGAHIPISAVGRCPFMFVTQNSALQAHANKFLRDRGFVKRDEFTPIVTDRYLAGLCWLISGGRSDNSPSRARLLANCATALRLKPELIERTKRFLSALDPEKAEHFEALMTNERASQYMMEVTLGNPNVITALNVEDVYEQLQIRATEKIAKEKDEFYTAKLDSLSKKVDERDEVIGKLRDQLVELDLEQQAKQIELIRLDELAREASQVSATQHVALVEQKAKIGYLTESVVALAESARIAKEANIKRHAAAIARSRSFADNRVKVLKWSGCGVLFLVLLACGLIDKFIVPDLSPALQKISNVILVLISGISGIFGVGIFFEWLMIHRIEAYRKRLFEQKILEMGYAPDDPVEQISAATPDISGLQTNPSSNSALEEEAS
jgi:hypothetical protein